MHMQRPGVLCFGHWLCWVVCACSITLKHQNYSSLPTLSFQQVQQKSITSNRWFSFLFTFVSKAHRQHVWWKYIVVNRYHQSLTTLWILLEELPLDALPPFSPQPLSQEMWFSSTRFWSSSSISVSAVLIEHTSLTASSLFFTSSFFLFF